MAGHRLGRSGAVLAVIAVIGVGTTMLTGIVPKAQAVVPPPAVGAVADITWGTSQADIDNTVSSMKAAGIRWVRANVSWSGGEAGGKGLTNHGYLSQIDYAVNQARAAGIEVLMPIADGVPYWASDDPAKYTDASGQHWNKYWRPTNVSDYADFVATMVNRYKGFGVQTYEVWNEPNHNRFWPSGPNAAEFTVFLAAAHRAIKGADPAATVVMGGLSKNDYDYLAAMYLAGARPYFDAVAVHPYTGIVDPTFCWNQVGSTKLAKDAFCAIEEVRKTMVAYGDSAKRLWLTEFGWSTSAGSSGVTETAQAEFLTKALDKVRSSYPYVAASFWYNFRNNFWSNDDPEDFEANLGLVRTDFSAKPSYSAMRTWTGAVTTATVETQAPIVSQVAASDFDGSGTTDFSVFRPDAGTWFVKEGVSLNYGIDGDIPVSADYDGDGKADVAVFRPSNGVWFIRQSSGGDAALAYGASGDIPVPADYDGDAKADIAVFRPSNGVWFIKYSAGGDTGVAWGTSGDVAVPGDYDGDDKADIAVFRSGTWFIRPVSGAADVTVNYGTAGDIPVPGHFDADDKSDIAVFRPSSGAWFLRHSSDGTQQAIDFGSGGDVPVPGDYNGDAVDDPAVFRPSVGVWFVETGQTAAWGAATDIALPLPAAIRTTYFPG